MDRDRVPVTGAGPARRAGDLPNEEILGLEILGSNRRDGESTLTKRGPSSFASAPPSTTSWSGSGSVQNRIADPGVDRVPNRTAARSSSLVIIATRVATACRPPADEAGEARTPIQPNSRSVLEQRDSAAGAGPRRSRAIRPWAYAAGPLKGRAGPRSLELGASSQSGSSSRSGCSSRSSRGESRRGLGPRASRRSDLRAEHGRSPGRVPLGKGG